jgi:hypothetical protein
LNGAEGEGVFGCWFLVFRRDQARLMFREFLVVGF